MHNKREKHSARCPAGAPDQTGDREVWPCECGLAARRTAGGTSTEQTSTPAERLCGLVEAVREAKAKEAKAKESAGCYCRDDLTCQPCAAVMSAESALASLLLADPRYLAVVEAACTYVVEAAKVDAGQPGWKSVSFHKLMEAVSAMTTEVDALHGAGESK